MRVTREESLERAVRGGLSEEVVFVQNGTVLPFFFLNPEHFELTLCVLCLCPCFNTLFNLKKKKKSPGCCTKLVLKTFASLAPVSRKLLKYCILIFQLLQSSWFLQEYFTFHCYNDRVYDYLQYVIISINSNSTFLH